MSKNPTRDAPSPAALIAVVLDAVEAENPGLPPQLRIPRDPAAVVLGAGSPLDSLGTVRFLLDLENRLVAAFGRSPRLLEDETVLGDAGAALTIGDLGRHLAARLGAL